MSDVWPHDIDRFMDALCLAQTQRIHRDVGRQVQRYQRRVSEAYETQTVEHKGRPQGTGAGPHGGWRLNMSRERGQDRT